MSDKVGSQEKRGFYGRRAGKPLNLRQETLMADLLPELLLTRDEVTDTPLPTLFDPPVREVWLESGFGGGEHLVHRALENPDIGYVGIEPFRNGMAKALVLIEDTGVRNIRLYHDEAGPFLDWLPANSLSGFYLLYPDPWPKKRHFKRRFVSKRNLDRITRALKPGAEFRFASDIDSYVEWTLDHCADHPAFEWLDGDLSQCLAPWKGWPGTRYEDKALREGRVPRYLSFRFTG
ncbi:MAG: tRNA (guanine(46)-N(7))-methyltransferase TrmB [Pseudomonadota bacterium]